MRWYGLVGNGNWEGFSQFILASPYWFTSIYRFSLPLSCSHGSISAPSSFRRLFSTTFQDHKGFYAPLEGSDNYLEWFCGITDSEGSFNIITEKKKYVCVFKFVIGTHKDDTGMLENIKVKLGLGTVRTYGKMSYFIVSKLSEVKILIDIFSSTPLNTNKRLNFLAWKEAYHIYTRSKVKSSSLKLEIENIQKSMNTNRSFDENSLSMLATRKDIKITPAWLLGFVEGDGSFFVCRGKRLAIRFSICQTSQEIILLEAIKEFFLSLPGAAGKHISLDISKSEDSKRYRPILVSTEKAYGRAKPASRLIVSNATFLKNVLIPFFDEPLSRGAPSSHQ
jgi:hypothetical protein